MNDQLPDDILEKLSKEIPRKPVTITDVSFICPRCNVDIFSGNIACKDGAWATTVFCPICGQRLDR